MRVEGLEFRVRGLGYRACILLLPSIRGFDYMGFSFRFFLLMQVSSFEERRETKTDNLTGTDKH